MWIISAADLLSRPVFVRQIVHASVDVRFFQRRSKRDFLSAVIENSPPQTSAPGYGKGWRLWLVLGVRIELLSTELILERGVGFGLLGLGDIERVRYG